MTEEDKHPYNPDWEKKKQKLAEILGQAQLRNPELRRLYNDPPKEFLDEVTKREYSPNRPLMGYSNFQDRVFLAYDVPLLGEMTTEGIDYRQPTGDSDVILGFDSTQPGRLLGAEIRSSRFGRTPEWHETMRQLFGANVWDRVMARVSTLQDGLHDAHTIIPANQYLRVPEDELAQLKERWRELHLSEPLAK